MRRELSAPKCSLRSAGAPPRARSVNLIWIWLAFLVPVIMAGGCAVLPVRADFVGDYRQEGVWDVFRHELSLKADGTFRMIVIAHLFDPADQEERDRWVNEISGRWACRGGTLTLHPEQERDDNPSAAIGLEALQFQVERGAGTILLVGGESERGLRFRK